MNPKPQKSLVERWTALMFQLLGPAQMGPYGPPVPPPAPRPRDAKGRLKKVPQVKA